MWAQSTVCPGATGVIYHSTPVAGAIYYEWSVPPGATIVSGQGDTIIVVDFGPGASSGNIILESFNGCNYGANASVYTIIVAASTTPTISLTSLPAGPVCPGMPVTFTATLSNTNIGAFTYNFKVNNISVQNSSSDSYTSSGLSNNDVVVCEVAIAATSCNVASTVVSNSIVITIAQPSTPSVTIAISPGETICSGEYTSFTATVMNTGNGNVTYNFMLNGISVQNGTSNIYADNTLSDGDQVSCVITIDGGSCLLTNNSSSNIIAVTVIPLSAPSINIVTASTEVCSHDSVSFSSNINNGGNNPVYQWQVNGINTGTNNSSFTTNNLHNGDIITCLLISDIACAFTNTALSNNIRLKVIDCDCSPIIPNAITPNGDGINDQWVISRENCIKKVSVSVYNRYGSLVYHSDDYHDDWNGKYKQKECPDGTYYYVINVFYLYKHEQVLRGNITILR
ncbi:MAG: gliding motility-associated C-terminal domain-containing protein [Ferruginibacter sp.]